MRAWIAVGLIGCHRAEAPAPAPTAASASVTASALATPSGSTSASSSASALTWTTHPAGHLDAEGRLCMPKATAQGTCVSPLRDEALCALPDCELVTHGAPSKTECCFAQRFRSTPAHRCVLAVETDPPRDPEGCGKAKCAGCGALDAKETARVRAVVPKACCYAGP